MPQGEEPKTKDSPKRVFHVDDEFVDSYSKSVGQMASLVFMALCRHSDKDGRCWPSFDAIGTKMGMSKPSVIKAIAALETHAIIEVTRGRDDRQRQSVNVYQIKPRSEWSLMPIRVSNVDPAKAKKKTSATCGQGVKKPCGQVAEPGKRRLPSRVNEPGKRRLPEGKNVKGTHFKEGNPLAQKSRINNLGPTFSEVTARLERRGIKLET